MGRPSLCLVTFGDRKHVPKASHLCKALNAHTAAGVQLCPLSLLPTPTAALPAWDLSSLYSTFYYSFDRPWIVTMRRQGQPSSAPSGAVQLHSCFFSSCQLVLTLCLFSPPSGGILLVEATLLTFKRSRECCWAAFSSSSTGALLPAFSLTVPHHSSPSSSVYTATQMLLASLPFPSLSKIFLLSTLLLIFPQALKTLEGKSWFSSPLCW